MVVNHGGSRPLVRNRGMARLTGLRTCRAGRFSAQARRRP